MREEYFALITGASQGIGKALAWEMAERGYNLVLHSLPGEGLPDLRDELAEKFKVRVVFFENDLTALNGPERLRDFIRDQSLKINFLINNAGVGFDGCIENHTPECIDKMLFLNIRAVTLLVHFLAEDLKQLPRSYILNISSFGGYLPVPYKSVYLASKSYIYYFTQALQQEFAKTNVRICVALPGAVKTNRKVLERINDSGYIGKVTALDAREFAGNVVRKMLNGKKVIIEGRLNSVIFSLAAIIPYGIVHLLLLRTFRNRANTK